MKMITGADEEFARDYEQAKPKQFGTLHERMKFVMEVAGKSGLCETHNDVWQALHDLALEVSYHKPDRPPFGRRGVKSPWSS